MFLALPLYAQPSTFVGCGAGSGSAHLMLACGMAVQTPLSKKIISWSAYTAPAIHRQGVGTLAPTMSTGFMAQVQEFTRGKWTADVWVLGDGGLTLTPTTTGATAKTFTGCGGGALGIRHGGWFFLPILQQVSGVASGWQMWGIGGFSW